MKRIVSILTTVVAAAALALTGPGAWAAPPDGSPGRPVHLALGDSLAAGHGSAPQTGSFESTVRQWKARGFVAQLHDTLRDRLDCGPDRPANPREGCPRLQTVNLARTGIPGVPASGVTTQTMLTPGDQLDRAVAIIEQRNGDASPRNDVEVVSLTVGGNDLFTPAVGACVLSPDPATTCAPTLGATFAGFAARYDQILGRLRAGRATTSPS